MILEKPSVYIESETNSSYFEKITLVLTEFVAKQSRSASILLLLLACTSFGQTSLTLTSGTVAPNRTTSLSLSVKSTGSNRPAALQWTFTYTASSVASIAVSAGSAATAAGKTLQCVMVPGAYSCLAVGMNSTAISDGVLAVLNLTLAASVNSVLVGVGNASAVAPSGTSISASGSGATATLNNPAPTVSSISPSTTAAGGGAFTLLINGTGFISSSVASWNGSARATTFVSATQLQAAITAADISSAGTASVSVVNPAPGGGTSGNVAFTITAGAPITSYQFVPVTPCRLMDTRKANGTFGGPFLAANATRAIPVPSGTCGIPSSAHAYSINVTAVPRTGFLAYLTLWPTGQSQPLVSTLNSVDGSILANAAIVPAGTGGSINAFATNDIDLVIDVNGYFAPPSANSLQFYPVTPCRVIDTRWTNGTFGGPVLAASTPRSFPIRSSSCGIPAAATAYSLNTTVVPRGPLGYLSVWPAGTAQPTVSTLNSNDGTILANATIIPAGTNGSVNFYATAPSDLVVDINGYFAPAGVGGLNFYPVPSCRAVDTRNPAGALGGPAISAQQTRTFPLPQSACGLPANASAYSLNVTAAPGGPLGYLTAWPMGLLQPGVSTLAALKGLPTANAAILGAGTTGSISVFVTDTTHVVIDVNGYFAQ